MVGLNLVLVTGIVEKEPELSYVRSTSVTCANFSIIVSRSVFGDSKPFFVHVNCYGKIAEKVVEKIKKGSLVFVKGELMNRRLKKYNINSVEIRGIEILPLDAEELLTAGGENV